MLCYSCDFELSSADAERKVSFLEEELEEISMRRDLDGLEAFVDRNSGLVLHENHFLILVAKRNALFVSRQRLVALLAGCDREERRALAAVAFKAKEEIFRDILGIIRTLGCEDAF